jgi:tetratricopeptide (TPR) repeat protein
MLAIIALSIFSTGFLQVHAQNQDDKKTETSSSIAKVNNFIISYSNNNKFELIENKIKTNPEDKFLKEIKLDMIYGTDLFEFLWNKNDIDHSAKIIETLKKANYSIHKMYLYEAIYYKRKGEWAVALPLLDHSLILFDKLKNKSAENIYFNSLALFEKGILTGEQNYIIQAIEMLERAVNLKPDNVVYLQTINEMFKYIEIPEELYEAFKKRQELYTLRLDNIKKQLILKCSSNVFYEKEKLENYYFDSVKQPLSEEILFNWKLAKYIQRSPADLLYFFQVGRNRKIRNIKIISIQGATSDLIDHTNRSLQGSRAPVLPDNYIYDTMNFLFIFSYR